MDELEAVVLSRTEAIEIFKRAYSAAGESASAYPRDFAGISAPRLCPSWLRPKVWRKTAVVSAVCFVSGCLIPVYSDRRGDWIQDFLIPLYLWSSGVVFALSVVICISSFRRVSLGDPAVMHRIAEQVWLERGPCDIAFTFLGPKRKWLRYHENNPRIKNNCIQ